MLTRGLLALAFFAGPAAALELSLPIECKLGEDCFVQQYMDRDSGKEARDYACGAATYDGHDGIDIRLRSASDADRAVAVLAAAAGTVRAVRDGEADRLVRNNAEAATVKDRECGNGALIDHGGGYETQYCHMRLSSVAVRKGDKVEAGQKIGEVGYSGLAAFPHVHVTVRENGKPVDPFSPDTAASCGAMAKPLWNAAAQNALKYQPGEVIALGFSDGPVDMKRLEDAPPVPALDGNSPALVGYVWAINLKGGDALAVRVTGPDGKVVGENAVTLDRNKAQYMLFTGKKRPPNGWSKGSYAAKVTVTRGGAAVIEKTAEIELR